jgi:hypothetical protein
MKENIVAPISLEAIFQVVDRAPPVGFVPRYAYT